MIVLYVHCVPGTVSTYHFADTDVQSEGYFTTENPMLSVFIEGVFLSGMCSQHNGISVPSVFEVNDLNCLRK